MNYTEFVSSHPTNTNTSITLTKQYIILKDNYNIEVFDLTTISNNRLNTLDSITNLEIAFNCCLDLNYLLIEYDNRGEPYASGVSLTVNDTSVFLDKRDINEFIIVLKNNLKQL